ncbi:uncharacterized protein ColSpa_01978 [Colletotrichum spaethianum]|uniref:Uncharacterized protein n=1 Tax=Colletotrichum spaethianum TaxID=700344 RepID=A0AA37NZ48_9PEZI|nr:uncharacterized protein ColSpa_01978 [Colletotrichum spaethianum]GKT41798.1 hypothetical protein ColSpa_01978 [Colletotrichum spaethianum]
MENPDPIQADGGAAVVLDNLFLLGGAVVLVVAAELGLNGGCVNAVGVEALAGALGELHVLLTALGGDGEVDVDVQGGDDLGVGELPDVDVVAAEDTGQVLDVLADLLEVNVVRGGLEENLGSRLGEGNSGLENNESDEQRDGGIGVEAAGPVGQPDDEGSDDDTNVAESVADDVKNHGVHSHIAVVVAVAASRLLALLVVVVLVVKAGLASRALGGGATTVVFNQVAVVVALGLEQRGLLVGLAILDNSLVDLALARRILAIKLGPASVDDLLSETRRVDADVLNASKARVVSGASSAAVMTLGGGGSAALGPTRRVGLPVEPNVTSRLRSGASGSSGDNGLGKDVANVTAVVVGSAREVGATFLGGVLVGVAVRVAMIVFAVVVGVIAAVGVAVAAEDKEADEVRGETEGTDDENQLGVIDLGRVEESGNGFENDGDAECDEEDGVEEGTENLSAQPLDDEVSSRTTLLQGWRGDLLRTSTCRWWPSSPRRQPRVRRKGK